LEKKWAEEGDGLHEGMADASWEGHTLLKTGLSAHRQTDRQAGRRLGSRAPAVKR